MATNNENLRALIRLIPPARALKDDLERSINLELYTGTGDLAVQSFRGLQASVSNITSDPYVASLTLPDRAGATDKEKVSLVLLAAGQLLAYLEGQTGLGGGGQTGHTHYQMAPNINLANIEGLGPGGADKVIEMVSTALKGQGQKESGAEGPQE